MAAGFVCNINLHASGTLTICVHRKYQVLFSPSGEKKNQLQTVDFLTLLMDFTSQKNLNPLSPKSDLQTLLCLTPDDFTHQMETP